MLGYPERDRPRLPMTARLPVPLTRLAAALLRVSCLLVAGVAGLSCGQPPDSRAGDGPVRLIYWEKWTGFEEEAMRDIVNRFNASQTRIVVEYVHMTDIRTKLLLATSGGNPPDVAGFFPDMMIKYAERGALMPLDDLMERDGISTERYLPAVIELCQYRDFYWGLPTTPVSTALHYNRRLFREAGLDPDRPPRTLQELDAYASRLTLTDTDGRILQLGFNPLDPEWFKAWYGWWFGANHWDGDGRMTLTTPEWIACLRWMRSFPEEYGDEPLSRFRAGGGQFGSSQNPFIAEKVAMQLQGVWMGNFIARYNPQMEWAAAPFPAVSQDMQDVTYVDTDILVIPKGSRHPLEAWEFIRFVQRQENLERLCRAQWKFSPLRVVSDDFYQGHPNPHIRMFRRLAESPNAHPVPMLPVIEELREEMYLAVDRVWLRTATPEQALAEAESKLQHALDRQLRQWSRVRNARLAEWEVAWEGIVE